ncbi:MAG: hypothetical protein IJC73_02880 [Lentisphaeria bacterium]|nr:hypothetical protein [Lentisphaeria bacterium]
MSEMLCVENGGVQYVPQILETKQIIYLDFDGALSRYDGEYLTVDRVEVTDSQLSPERVAAIVTALNAQFAGMNIEFVSERPDSAEYSTIFVGKTSAFDSYGNYAGLAETIDHDNANKSDNAFVMLDAASSDAEIVSVISHEAAHLTGLLDHGGSGLDAYAVTSTFSGSYQNSMFIVTGDDITLIGGGTYATTIAYGGRLTLRNGAYADDLHIRAGGVLAVSSGCRVTSVTVSSGGSMYVNEYAAYLNAVNILDGAVVNLSGSVPLWKIHVSSGGALHLSSGIQYSSGLQIYSSGKAIVRSGAVVSNAELLESKARLLVSSGGSAVEARMNKGTTIEVYQGGELSSNHRRGSATAFGTCQINVRGGRMVNTTLYGTTADIFSGGLASQVNIIDFGLIQVRSGGYVNNVTIEKNGKMTFADYASGGKVTVQSGGLLDIYTTGTLLSSVTIEKNGLLQGFTFASTINMISIGGAEIKP